MTPPPPFPRAAIVGLGLIGGSLARDLAALGVQVEAYDADASAVGDALASGVIECSLDESLADLRADVVVIATPVDAATGVLRRIAASPARPSLVSDVGSTKARIVAEAAALGLGGRFVGSHPMAGDHRSGWSASRRGLFDGARIYLCAAEGASAELVERVEALWRAVGGRPEVIGAAAHDSTLAWSSHLPHVISAALALALRDASVARHDLGPGGRDITRLAGSSPEMWSAIAAENADALDRALAAAEREVASFRQALSRADAGELRSKFAAARAWFDG